jgi:hypothetical protein
VKYASRFFSSFFHFFLLIFCSFYPSQSLISVDKKIQKKKNSLLELLETEKNYHYRLDIICTHFVAPLKKEATKPGGEAGFITLDLVGALFSCIEEIRDISTSVKDELIQVIEKKGASFFPSLYF